MSKDLREFIEFLEERHPGEVIRIREAVDPVFELAGIRSRLEKAGRDAVVIFERVKGSDVPLVGNVHGAVRRLQLALGIDGGDLRGFLQEYGERESRPVEPRRVKTGPVKEVILRGEDVDLDLLPICTYHERDAGPYITAGLCVTRDPETGVNNVGIYRLMKQGRDRLGIFITGTSHAYRIRRRHEARGEPTPIAVVLGHHPGFFLGCMSFTPYDVDEFHVAGGILQEPVELVPCETLPLEVPARAEIVLEGEILPDVREREAPFGEYPGTYGPQRMSPVLRVKCMTMRKDPLYEDAFPAHPDHLLLAGVTRSSFIFKTVKIACPTVQAVHMPPSGKCRFVCYVAIEKMIEGEAKQAAMAAFTADPFLKFAVVVDADVDVTKDSEVMAAIATRVRADTDIFMVPYAKGSPLDTASYDPAGGSHLVTKTGIDATRKPGYPDEVRVPGEEEIDLGRYLPDLLRGAS
ncbi:MAG: UbiD family decarboxylase [Nitrospinota bacterium]